MVHSLQSSAFLLAGFMHLLISNTRWLSVLCMLCTSQCSLFRLCYWPWKCKAEQKIFVNNALRHLGYENTQLHRHSTQLNVLMFEFANPSFFYEVMNNGLNILSSEKSGTDAHSVGWKCIWVDLKILISNSMQCQFQYIYHKSRCIFSRSRKTSIKLTDFKTSQGCY